jgi:UDP-glucose 4-epimerase
MAILVTGGAGYIGSHVVRQLSEAGEPLIVLDDLSTGYSDALIYGEKFIKGNVGDSKLLELIFHDNEITSVMHFAASIVVPESVTNPIKYFQNNTVNALALIESCAKHKVKNFIFSSTAAVYGSPEFGLASEKSALSPVNPYGHSKLMSEFILNDVSLVSEMKYVILRYFNAAGADPKSRMGQRSLNATHLIKIACEAAVGKRSGIEIFGDDYETPDGTCLRDYIHIEDLAQAHLLALKYLRKGGESTVLNAGYGKASSVLEVIKAVEEVSKKKINVEIAQRRPGDPAKLVAESKKIRELLGWQPVNDDLLKIVSDAFAWEQKL